MKFTKQAKPSRNLTRQVEAALRRGEDLDAVQEQLQQQQIVQKRQQRQVGYAMQLDDLY